jgi:hypothetical protein
MMVYDIGCYPYYLVLDLLSVIPAKEYMLVMTNKEHLKENKTI